MKEVYKDQSSDCFEYFFNIFRPENRGTLGRCVQARNSDAVEFKIKQSTANRLRSWLDATRSAVPLAVANEINKHLAGKCSFKFQV